MKNKNIQIYFIALYYNLLLLNRSTIVGSPDPKKHLK